MGGERSIKPFFNVQEVQKMGMIINPYRFATGTALKTGLISCWEFEETSGSTCSDSHGDNDFTISGASLDNSAGLINKSIYFNGSNSYIYRASDNNLSPQSAHTISVWVKRYGNTTGGGSATVGSLLSRYYGLSGARVYYTALFDSDSGTPNRLTFVYYDSTQTATSLAYNPASDIWTGNWKHILFIRNGAKMYIYVDGSLAASTSGGNGSMYQTTNSLAQDMIGALAKSNSAPDFYLNGYVTQVAVWNVALTDADKISALYNSGNGLAYSAWH